jgi:hypothetical protein
MATLQEIMLRAQLLREETAVDSISPERAGSIMYDTLAYINQMQLQGANPLLISKIYASVAAMEADSAPVSDLTGEPLRPGQVVVIATGDPDDPDEGVVYRYDGTDGGASSWTAVRKIGNVEPVDSLDSDSTQLPLAARQGKVLDGKLTELGQKIFQDVGNLQLQIDEIIGSEDIIIDLSAYTPHIGNILLRDGTWGNKTSGFEHIVIPVVVGQHYSCVSNGGIVLQYAFLTDYGETIGAAPLVPGTSVVQKSIGVVADFVIPETCQYLYLKTMDNGVSAQLVLTHLGAEGELPKIKSDISDLEDARNYVLGVEDTPVDLSGPIANAGMGIISFSTGAWVNRTSAYKHIIVPVSVGKTYLLEAKATGTLSLRYALLKSYTGSASAPDYCSGWTKPVAKAKGVVEEVLIPSDCTCIYFEYINNTSSVADLSVIEKGTVGKLEELEEQIDNISVPTAWAGKKIAWFGTSIPAGSNFPIPIKANAIDAYITSYKVEKTSIAAEDNLPCEYPVIAASLLGASTIYNESVGSSRITKNTTDPRLLIRCKGLCNTVQEICSYIWGSYNIDIVNQTFSENHENTIGITTFLTTAGTWSSFVNNVMQCLSQSYQIKLALRHLISDSTQRSSYVSDVFGTYYSDVVSMLTSVGYTLADLVGYNEADLFVLEHSVNDSNPSMEYPVTSTDVTTFQGAYNKVIGEILRYKPSARIAIVSNYGPDLSEIQYDKDKTAKLKEIAEHWQIAFCEMRKYINVAATKQMTQGYWEQNANVWHDSGFQWSEDAGNDSFTTNAYFHPDLYSSSLATIKQNINPQQIHGVWYWEAPARYIWMRDAVHPHSDNAGRLCIILAKTLAKWLDVLGNV